MSNTLTLQQAAQLMGVSEMTLRRHIKQGKIKATLQYGRYFVDFDDLPVSKNSLRDTVEKQITQTPVCDLTTGIEEHDLRSHLDDSEISLYQACVIAGHVAWILFRYYGLSSKDKPDEYNQFMSQVVNCVEECLHSIGLTKEDFEYEDTVIVRLQQFPQTARELYRLATFSYRQVRGLHRRASFNDRKLHPVHGYDLVTPEVPAFKQQAMDLALEKAKKLRAL